MNINNLIKLETIYGYAKSRFDICRNTMVCLIAIEKFSCMDINDLVNATGYEKSGIRKKLKVAEEKGYCMKNGTYFYVTASGREVIEYLKIRIDKF